MFTENFYDEFLTLTAASAGAATAPWKRAARAMTAAKKAENCMLIEFKQLNVPLTHRRAFL
jgi:hypothetical protein